MYTIIMNSDKSLTASVKTVLFQREKLVDKLQFLFPEFYEDIDLKDCKILLKYLDQANVAHTEQLIRDEELYKERIRCVMPVDTKLTRFAGDITLRVSFVRLNVDNELTEEVLHSDEITITIKPLKDYYAFVADESLEMIDKKMLEMQAKIDATAILAESIDKNKADDLSYENNELQLMANGKKIGTKHKFDFGEYEVIEFKEEKPEPPEETNEYDVIEFW